MNPSVPARAGRREWIGLGVIALPCLLYSMDLTVLNLAVPQLSADLRPTSAQLLWIVDIYGFVLAGFLIPMGTLGDRIGRRRLLLLGAGAFGVASVAAAFSRSAAMLIVTRAVLGVAGATLAPSTLSLIRNMFVDANQRTFAIGVWITSYSIGGAIGPLIGGVVLDHFWWGSVFLIGVPVMVLLLVVGPILLPEFRDPAAGRLDLLSASLSLSAVLLVIYGVKQVAQGAAGPAAAISIAAGVAIAAVFVLRQRRLADPLIDLRLFKNRQFSAALGSYTLGTAVAFGTYFFVAQYLQLVLGLTPLHAGLWTLPFFAAFVAGSMLTPALARRVGARTMIGGGLLVAAAGFVVLSRVPVYGDEGAALGTLVGAIILYSLGLAPVFTLATDLIVGAAPPERAGAASALSETGSELGGALGIAVLGSVGTIVYRAAISHSLPPELTLSVQEAARSTLGGALAVAKQLPVGQAAAVACVAREAFGHALSTASVISAAVAAGAALIIFAVLRTNGRR